METLFQNVCQLLKIDHIKTSPNQYLANFSQSWHKEYSQERKSIETFLRDWWDQWASCLMLTLCFHFFSLLSFEKDGTFNCANLKFLHLRLFWAKKIISFVLKDNNVKIDNDFFLLLYHCRLAFNLCNPNIFSSWLVNNVKP